MGDEAQKATAELVSCVASLAQANNALVAEIARLRAADEHLARNQTPGLRQRTSAPRGRG